MKEKIKLEQYAVYEKGRVYEVLVFPFLENMYVHYCTKGDFDEEGGQIDASRAAYAQICYAMAILADDPGKLLYFPCKQPGYGGYYPFTYHMVLCRPELQFRRSLWMRIRGKLDKKHWQGKYILRYDKEKLCDYFEKVLVRKYGYCGQNSLGSWAFKIQPGRRWKRYEGLIEEKIDDTIFFVPERTRCYDWQYWVVEALEDEEWENEKEPHGMFVYKGYIFSDKTVWEINKLYDKQKEEKVQG